MARVRVKPKEPRTAREIVREIERDMAAEVLALEEYVANTSVNLAAAEHDLAVLRVELESLRADASL